MPLPAQLPRTAFSVLSYNILLPNSVDGWWTYKNYSPVTPMAARSWEARKRLLEQRIRTADADVVVCFQEAPEL
jgi:mRNA deadenylase 3'-5' endonuclease subunit Ccr4